MVLGNLRDYSAYLEGLGLKGGEKKIRVRIVSSLGAREVLTSDNVIEIDPRIVSDVDMARMAYTDYVLLSNVDTNEIQRMLASLSNGINYYLTASYAGRAQLASITAKVRNVNTPYLHNLDNQQPLSSVFETTIAGGGMWGGSLWAIRSARVRLSSDETAECDLMPIYVRTIPLPEPEKERKPRAKTRSRQPSKYVVVFDTETTFCQAQCLRLGTYQVFKGRILIKSGFFHGPALSNTEIEFLKGYSSEHGVECLSRAEFMRNVLFHFCLKFRARIVGFNLPFDLSRLAIDWGKAQGDMLGGFSLKLDENNFQPRLRIKKLGAKSCKIEWGSSWDGKTRAQRKADKERKPDRFIGSFVDVSTMAFALTSKVFSLESLCKHLGVPGKSKIKGHGRTLDSEYLDYAMEDVRATKDCFFKLDDQLAAHKLKRVSAEALYSPASLGKAYLRAMNIKPWQEYQPDFPPIFLRLL